MLPGEQPIGLAVALAGVCEAAHAQRGATSVREALAWANQAGFRGVCLDGTVAGLRARDLDRSARRDLAASMRRVGLASAGIDLFLPPDHLLDSRWVDRAIGAATGALGLAADLAALTEGHAVVCMNLPPTDAPPEWMGALIAEAQRIGARLADCAWPRSAHADASGPVGVGIDAAAVLAGGADPAAEMARAGAMLTAVRMSDWDGASRVPIGRGRLDELAFRVAIHTCAPPGMVMVDARGTPDPRAAAEWAAARCGAVRPDAGQQ